MIVACLEAVAPAVEAAVDPLPLFLQPIRLAIVAAICSPMGSVVEATFDAVPSGIEALIDPVASVVAVSVTAVAIAAVGHGVDSQAGQQKRQSCNKQCSHDPVLRWFGRGITGLSTWTDEAPESLPKNSGRGLRPPEYRNWITAILSGDSVAMGYLPEPN